MPYVPKIKEVWNNKIQGMCKQKVLKEYNINKETMSLEAIVVKN